MLLSTRLKSGGRLGSGLAWIAPVFQADPLTRGLATKKKSKKVKKPFDLGWDALRAKYEAIPVQIPGLTALEVTHGRSVDGHAGVRKFIQAHFAQLRWQNPEASIWAKGHRHEERATVSITLNNGAHHELDVKGMVDHEVLRQVLTNGGVQTSLVDDAVQLRLAQIEVESRSKQGSHEKDEPSEEENLLEETGQVLGQEQQ